MNNVNSPVVKRVTGIVAERMKVLGLNVTISVEEDGIEVSFDSASRAICEAARDAIENRIANVFICDNAAFVGIRKLAIRFSEVSGLMTTSVKARFSKFVCA